MVDAQTQNSVHERVKNVSQCQISEYILSVDKRLTFLVLRNLTKLIYFWIKYSMWIDSILYIVLFMTECFFQLFQNYISLLICIVDW